MTPGHLELRYLLDLNGEVMVLDKEAKYWAKFRVEPVANTPDRPHGIKYSLTLHDRANARIAGIDNAHAISVGSGPGRQRTVVRDHMHRLAVVKPYSFKGAGPLIRDFWELVDSVIRELEAKNENA